MAAITATLLSAAKTEAENSGDDKSFRYTRHPKLPRSQEAITAGIALLRPLE